jgi:sugar/nucleoside kinase (ribokinase family)
MSRGVICAGRVYCDMVFSGLTSLPQASREIFADDLRLHAGGGAYITAAYLSALGRPSALLTRLPEGPFARIVMDEAAANRIDISAVALESDPTPQVTVAMVGAGDRAFLTRRVGAALPDDPEAAFARPNVTHLHIGELTTLIEHPDLPELARSHGMTVSLDCAWDDEALARDDLRDLIGLADIFLPNVDEAKALAPDGEVQALAGVVVVKDGAGGATCHWQGRSVHRPAVKSEVVDTTGAGDAFVAGFLHGWIDGLRPEACLDLGNRCGALAVSRLGGAGILPALDFSN